MRFRKKTKISSNRVLKAILWIFFLLIFTVLTKPFWQKNIWNGTNRVSLVLESWSAKDPSDVRLAVFSYDPMQTRALYLTIPENTMLDVPFGYETFQASSVYKLGELDRKRGGGRLLDKSIQNTFGIVLDGFYVFDVNAFSKLPQNQSEVIELKKKYFSWSGLLTGMGSLFNNQSIDTNISFTDKLHLWNTLRRLRLDQIAVYNPDKMGLLTDIKLPDNTTVKIVDKDLYDAFFDEYFYDSPVRAEKITIEIVNATSQERVASQFSRLMEGLGANVIIKSTADKEEDYNCMLYLNAEKLKRSSIVSKLMTIYKCNIGSDNDNTLVQADLKVILGKGYLQ